MAGVELVNEHSILIDKLTTLLAIYLLIQIEYLVVQVVEIVDIVSEYQYDDCEEEAAVKVELLEVADEVEDIGKDLD